MASNFTFLNNESWQELYELARSAERYGFVDPRASAVYSRIAAEAAVQWMYRNDHALTWPYEKSIYALTNNVSFQELVGYPIIQYLDIIRRLGNNAAHPSKKPDYRKSYETLQYLHAFLEWIVKTYEDKNTAVPSFDETLIPTRKAAEKSHHELFFIQQKFETQQEELREQREALRKSEEGRKALEAQLRQTEQIRERNRGAIIQPPFSEAETRKKYIDILLEEAGWDLEAPRVKEYEVTGMPTPSGKGKADYVLWGANGLPLAVVEAKRTLENERKGQTQAQLYAGCLEKMSGQRPIIFYTNGFTTWLWDDLMYPPRQVQGFYTRDELNRLIVRRKDRRSLKSQPLNNQIVDRYYQEEAIRRVTEAWEKGGRKALLVMATGSGKTRVSAGLSEILMKANWVKNALFLADRNALVTQSKNAYNEYLPHLTLTDLTKEKENEKSRMVFSTYPTLMNLIDTEKEGGDRFYTPGHFDLIIVDEAHRSVYLKYKAIFDYFDALLLGLTATPKSDIDHNTFDLFGCGNNVPTYEYELDKAVKDGYLVPPKSIAVPTRFRREGIHYDELSEKEKEEYELTFRDEEGNLPDTIGSTALDDWLFNKNTADQILSYVMENGLKIEGGDKLGKTIIFARSHKHAEFIEDRFNHLYPEHKGHFLRIIDNYDKYAQKTLENFTEKDKMPQIAVSVDMLDTGINIHEILNLVFWKPVKSVAKFWQMVGRGTRKCDNLFGPGQHKEYFLIFDFCENFEFFRQLPRGIAPGRPESLSQKIFKTRLQIAEILRDEKFQEAENLQNYREHLLDTLHQSISTLDRNKITVRPHNKFVEKYADRGTWSGLSEADKHMIRERLSALPEPEGKDEMARRFDLLTLNLQVAMLQNSKAQENYVLKIQNFAQHLAGKKGNIPVVSAQMPLIKELMKNAFWQRADVGTVDEVREKLRGLVSFADKKEKAPIYTDFKDEISYSDILEHDLMKHYVSGKPYRQKIENFIRDHINHLTIRKLNTNQPITTAELAELEKLMFESGELGTKDEFQKMFGTDQPLGYFIRKIIGLDVNAAKEAFSAFLSKGTLNANQIQFINCIIDHLTINGTIDKSMLFNVPFTDINDDGLLGVFPEEEATKIIKIIDSINNNAGTSA